MERANKELRKELNEKSIAHWQLAQQIGISCGTMVRWLREPLRPDRALKIRIAIDEMSETN